MISYRKAKGVGVTFLGRRPLFSLPLGGRVATDPRVVALWESAHGRELEELLDRCDRQGQPRAETLIALTCLAEGGLLQRNLPSPPEADEGPPKPGPLVSVVLVGYNSRDWLAECLPSLAIQTQQPLEIIVVDNGSQDDTGLWLPDRFPAVKLFRLEKAGPLSRAINYGVSRAGGAFFLLLNPDTVLDPKAVERLLEIAGKDPGCAAVAAKLRLRWAPSFLNGLGNFVGYSFWGMDIGLGQLDLGQFDHWSEVPSACFAATLIPRSAWEKVGPADESFPLYYEDSEWCYRSRALGYSVRVAPRALVFHAFGGRAPGEAAAGLSPSKRSQVTYGRLRFAVKLAGRSLPRFLRNYMLEDLLKGLLALTRFDLSTVQATGRAWKKFLRDLSSLRRERNRFQKRRLLPDRLLFSSPPDSPPTLIWRGWPELTWDLIQFIYGPLIRTNKTRPLPEWACHGQTSRALPANDEPGGPEKEPLVFQWSRSAAIWRTAGFQVLRHRIRQYLAWRLVRSP